LKRQDLKNIIKLWCVNSGRQLSTTQALAHFPAVGQEKRKRRIKARKLVGHDKIA